MVSAQVIDVVVVGAGLSGLQAAANVQKAGLSCVVLEATDRIGGKVLSAPISPKSNETVDLGAAWINDTSQSKVYALAKRYGVEFQKQMNGDVLYELGDKSIIKLGEGMLPFAPEDQQVFLNLVMKLGEIGQQIKEENFLGSISKELDKLTFEIWVRTQTNHSPSILSFMDAIADTLVGAGCGEFSALYMIKYIESGTGFLNVIGDSKDGGQYLRPFTGSKSYVEGLASELDPDCIILQSPVEKIEQHEDHSTISCLSTGTKYKARKVIISVPTALYKHITFSPPLPPSKVTLGNSTKLGYYSKIIFIYSTPWWRLNGFSGQLVSLVGPVRCIFDTCIDERKQYSLSLFMVGDTGRQWSKLTKSEREKTASDHMKKCFSHVIISAAEIPEPVNVIEYEWSKQDWFEGAPSPVYPPGLLTSAAGKALTQPVGGLHFVGTETAEVWKGYMDGALRSGERGASEVIAALKR